MPRRSEGRWFGRVEQHGGRWRFDVGEGGDRLARRSFATEKEAEKHRRALVREEESRRQKVATLTLDQALSEYEPWYEAEGPRGKGSKPQSARRECMRVALYFGRDEGPLEEMTSDQAAALYKELQGQPSRRKDADGQLLPLSVAEHQCCLKATRRFGAWLVLAKYWRANPFEAVRPIGQPRRGKRQLSIDQGRLWVEGAFQLAHAGDAPVLAALTCLLLGGRRAMEVGSRHCSELDDGGRVLRVTSAKTAAGVMVVPVLHEELRVFAHVSATRTR